MRQCVTEANDDVRTLTAMIENRMICGEQRWPAVSMPKSAPW